jgi:adenylate cyclase
MGVEIERKFLVEGEAWRTLGESTLLRQGYLSLEPNRTVRVRIDGERAFLTIKGKSVGASRGEWEYPIPVLDAAELLDTLCQQPLVEKVRHRIANGPHTWEVDEFLGANAGLVVAEIELVSEDEAFEQPDWIGREVTGDARYFNSRLISHPYSQWKDPA